MSFNATAGTVLSVTDAAPNTYYPPLYDVFTPVGEVVDLGQGHGRDYNRARHSPLSQRQVSERKASFALQPVDITMAWHQSDAGQTVLRSVEGTDAILTFEITKPTGESRYFSAQVLRLREEFGRADDVDKAVVTLVPQQQLEEDEIYLDLFFRIFRPS